MWEKITNTAKKISSFFREKAESAKEKGGIKGAIGSAYLTCADFVSGKVNYIKDKIYGDDYDPRYDNTVAPSFG